MLILPKTFPSMLTVQSILSDKSIVAFLALAEMVVISANQFDLSVGYMVSLLHSLAIGLMVAGMPWLLVCALTLGIGLAIGAAERRAGALRQDRQLHRHPRRGHRRLRPGRLVHRRRADHRRSCPPASSALDSTRVAGFPLSALLLLVLATAMWIVFEFLPTGRYLYVIGANERTAELTGIRVNRYVIGAFCVSGVITAFASLVLAARIQVGQSNVGQEFLLPAFVGALLGATTVKPGRVNVWGTVVAVLILAVGISGIEQLGGAFYVEPLFNGSTLVIAVGMAGWAARRRLRSARSAAVPAEIASKARGLAP